MQLTERHPHEDHLPEGFHMTELGPLPTEWRVVRVGEVVSKTCQVDPRKHKIGSFRYVDVSSIDNQRWCITAWQEIKADKAPSRARKLIKSNDVLLATVRPYLKRVALVPPHLDGEICSTAFCVLRAKPHVLCPYYLFYTVLTDWFTEAICEHQRGSSYPAITDSDVLKAYIPLPPLAEQQAIAQVLRTVQQAQSATDKVIDALHTLKQSLMRHLFTYGAVPVDQASQAPLQETELGTLPAHWQVVRLGEVVSKTSQVDPRKHKIGSFRYVDVSSVDHQRLSITSWQEMEADKAPSRARKLIKSNDVILATVRPYLKRIALVPPLLDGEICSTAFCVLRAKPDILSPYYLFYTVATDWFTEAICEHQRGSSYPAITDTDVLKACIPLPPLDEQRAIAQILHAVDAKIATERAYRAALDALFRTLLHQLMTGQIRVVGAMQASDAAPIDECRTGDSAG